MYLASCITGSISLFASYLTVRLVSLMKMNGYLQLVTMLAIVQVFVDLGHIMTFQNRMQANTALCQSHGIFLIFGNLSATIWTNFISISVFYIVFFGRSLDIKKHFPIFFVLGVIFPLLIAICASALHFIEYSDELTASCFLPPVKPIQGVGDDTDDNLYSARVRYSELYNDIHYISLGLNCIIAFATIIKIFFFNTTKVNQGEIGRVSMLSLVSTLSVATPGKSTRRQIAMRTLALRLILYPASEVFNEIFRIADSATGNTIFALNFLHAVINGLLGTFFFITFLLMQPKARVLLYNMKYNFCFPSIWGNKTVTTISTDGGHRSHQVSWDLRGVQSNLDEPLAAAPLLEDMDEDQLALEILNPSNADECDDMTRGSVRESVRESEMNRASGATYGPMGSINRITTTTK